MVSTPLDPEPTPITIGDGSLKLSSPKKAWSQWTDQGSNGDDKDFPDQNLNVSSVAVTVNGNTTTISYNGEKCDVIVESSFTQTKASTNNGAKGLKVKLNPKKFADFTSNSDGTALTGGTSTDHITQVTVKKQGQQVFDQSGLNGGTSVTINLA
jgi:hypothetical protein